MTGAGIFAYTWKEVYPKITQLANLGNKTLPSLWNVNALLIALVFILVTLLLFYLLERKIGQRADKME